MIGDARKMSFHCDRYFFTPQHRKLASHKGPLRGNKDIIYSKQNTVFENKTHGSQNAFPFQPSPFVEDDAMCQCFRKIINPFDI